MKQIRIPYRKLAPYFDALDRVDDERWSKIEMLEAMMRVEFKIPELGFHFSEYGHGIGTPDCPEMMKLVQPKMTGKSGKRGHAGRERQR